MKKIIALTSGVLTAFAVPLVSLAQVTTNADTFKGIGTLIIGTINTVLVPVIFALAFIVFLWGAFDVFILGANSEEVKEKGKNLMLWGLIGFFVMVSIWGLVNILTSSVLLSNTAPTKDDLPCFPVPPATNC